jgi:phosphoribosylformylglycinamidine synthase subunit PurL
MVGELPDPAQAPGIAPGEGDRLVLVGPFAPTLAGSELAKQRGELDAGLPQVEIGAVAVALSFVRQSVRDGIATAAHDVSDGGLACALAEMAIAASRGIEGDLDPLVELRGGSGESCLFGEGPGGIVLGVAPERLDELLKAANESHVGALAIGLVAGNRLEFSAAERDVSVALADAERAWRSLAERL